MKRFTVQIALVCTLLVMLGMGVCALYVMPLHRLPQGLLMVMPLVALGCFGLSMALAHFLTSPLRTLHKTIRAIETGERSVDFPAGECPAEVLDLKHDFERLCAAAARQQATLTLREERQADFVADLAHELRTPLTAIRGGAELMDDPDLPWEMRQRFAHTIRDEAERLTRLTNDLLTLQHIENDRTGAELSRIDLHALADEVADTMTPILSVRDVACTVEGEAPDVLANPDRLKQVLVNLIENASRFSDEGGEVRVELTGVDSRSVIKVMDDGPGFGDVEPALLFERFYRADVSRTRGTGGSGLGLAIVKSSIEAMGGSVSAYNLPVRGACFVVLLPSIPLNENKREDGRDPREA